MEKKEHTLDRSVDIGSSSPNCGLLWPLHLSPLDELIGDSCLQSVLEADIIAVARRDAN